MDHLGGIQSLPLHCIIGHSMILSLLHLLFSFKGRHTHCKRQPGMTQRRHKSQNETTWLCTGFGFSSNSVDRMYIQHTQSLFAEIIKFSKDARKRNT